MPRALILLLVAALLAGCASQRKAMERAATYERGGMLQEAFDTYARVHQRGRSNVDAHVGMKRTAQGLFDRMQMDAAADYRMGDLGSGDTKRREAAGYKDRMDRLGLGLQWDPALESQRREAYRSEASRLLADAETAFREDRFPVAEDLASRSLRLDPERREAEYLQKLARLEPIYRQGLRATELSLWRDAYQAFKRVTDSDPGYKDAWTLMNEARDEARVVLAYVPLFHQNLYAAGLALTNPGTLESILAATFKQAILDRRDPLLVLVDRDNTDQLLAEQQRQMSGMYDDTQVVEAGKLIGARYVVTARILRYDEILRRETEVQMQLLDAQSGRIHLSEIIRVNRQELARGNTRTQLLERAGKRMAARVAEFDPHKR